ncbi:MAG: NUDIX domain-containing protein [Promethearchaeota archaeon]|nr:MAG: NUDIX domain-containing protein [Candidatus Lokiarchaeota archaeon]
MKEEHSAAAVVYHNRKFLLLKYEMGHWGFVKGNIEKGESKKETILRELKEETSIEDAKIIEGFQEKFDYYYKWEGKLIHKQVDCYLIKSGTENVELSYEHSDYAWLSYENAMKRLSHDNTKKILEKVNKFLKSRLDHYMTNHI